MKKIIIIINLLISYSSISQVCSFNKELMDSLKKNQFTCNLYIGFDYTQDALKYLYLSSNAAGMFIGKTNTYNISGIINYKGLERNSTSNNGYVAAKVNLWHHRFIDDIIKPSKINFEPFVMFQFDENRGVNGRWQTGVYGVPLILDAKYIEIYGGFGVLYQFDKYDLLPSDYKGWWDEQTMEQISTDIIQLKPDGSKFMNRESLRGALFISSVIGMGKVGNINFVLSYQQPYHSIFYGTALYDKSSDYKIPYPCINFETIINFQILKWLSFDLRYYMQHDRNQLTYYLPYYVYTITSGVTFSH